MSRANTRMRKPQAGLDKRKPRNAIKVKRMPSTTAATMSVASTSKVDEDNEAPFTVEVNIDRRPDPQFLSDIDQVRNIHRWTGLV